MEREMGTGHRAALFSGFPNNALIMNLRKLNACPALRVSERLGHYQAMCTSEDLLRKYLIKYW